MDNLKSPAAGFTARFDGENTEVNYGFTKLELASLMIAQGWISGTAKETVIAKDLAEASVKVAKAVLEQANK